MPPALVAQPPPWQTGRYQEKGVSVLRRALLQFAGLSINVKDKDLFSYVQTEFLVYLHMTQKKVDHRKGALYQAIKIENLDFSFLNR